jgi:hypothetical protein
MEVIEAGHRDRSGGHPGSPRTQNFSSTEIDFRDRRRAFPGNLEGYRIFRAYFPALETGDTF